MLERVWTSYLYYLTHLVEACAHALGRFGRFAVKRTLLVTLVSLVIIMVPYVGILRFRTESRSDKLWIPQESESLMHRDWVIDNYGTSKGMATFVVMVKPDQNQFKENVIQLQVTDEIFHLDGLVRQLEASRNGRKYRFDDLCYKDVDGGCSRMGYLNFWNMSRNTYRASVGSSLADTSQGNKQALLKSINVQTFPDGSAVSTLSIFAGIEFAPTHPPSLVAAKAIQVIYPLDQTASTSASEAWLKKFLKLMKDQKTKTKYIQIEYFTSNSVDLEVARSITADMYLIAISILVFATVAVVAMTKWNAVGSRASLAVVGLVGAILAITSGYCLSMAFGVPFTSLQQTLPYILGGVAVDIMLVMVKGLDDLMLTNPDLSMGQRFEKLMAGPGLSVAVTSLASACAFALGTVSKLPSIAWFSAYATISVLAIFFMQVFFFLAIFVYCERRIAANRLDCLCCVVHKQGCSCCCGPSPSEDCPAPTMFVARNSSKQLVQDHAGKDSVGVEQTSVTQLRSPQATVAMAHAPRQQKMDGDNLVDISLEKQNQTRADPSDRKGLSRFIETVYTPWLLWWPVKVAVILVFTGYLVVSCIAIDKLKEGQPMEDVCPDDSWVIPYIEVNRDTFWAQTGDSAGLYYRDLPFEEPTTQAQMLSALSHTLDNPYVNVTLSAFQSNWLMSFMGWAASRNVTLDTAAGCSNPFVGRKEFRSSGQLGEFLSPVQVPGCIPADLFYPLLKEWTTDPSHSGLKQYLVMGADSKLKASNFAVQLKSRGENYKYGRLSLESFKKTSKAINRQVFKSNMEVFFIHTDDFIFGEGDAILKEMTFEYVGLAVLGVGVVLLIMLVHPMASLLMMVAVLLVDLYLFGEMWILGIRFNAVSTINLIMSTGLAVDYSVYIASKFMTTHAATRDKRITIALAETGSAVLQGVVAALAGTIPLAFTSSVILRTFFSLIFGTILFSGLVGLVLMPVLFSLIGPAALNVGIPAH